MKMTHRIITIIATLFLCLGMANGAENDCLKQMREQSAKATVQPSTDFDFGKADGKIDEKAGTLAVGLEPYGTISWTGLEGSPELGAGLGATVGITKDLSITAFAEGDSLDDPNFFDQIDRAGAGLRYTAWLGSKVSLDGGVEGAWDIQNSVFFLRLPLGANLYALKTKNVDLGLRAQYAFDISGHGPNGTATGRAFAGPVLNLRF